MTENGGIEQLVRHVDMYTEDIRLPAVAALGFIAGVSPELALQVYQLCFATPTHIRMCCAILGD